VAFGLLGLQILSEMIKRVGFLRGAARTPAWSKRTWRNLSASFATRRAPP
jgi:hypothetical protein